MPRSTPGARALGASRATLLLLCAQTALGFSGSQLSACMVRGYSTRTIERRGAPPRARAGSSAIRMAEEPAPLTVAQREELGNLVADDEYLGLTMELTELVRIAIREELKAKLRDFVGKSEYKVGDISKELDDRVKTAVAAMRDKDEYELGDLSIALDTFAKQEVERLSGKPYAPGDLSVEIDRRIKLAVGEYTGKGTYEAGDLQREVRRRVAVSVEAFTGKEYAFGDVSREINRRRAAWIQGYLGRDGYEFGDLTKRALANLTGKEEGEYRFGDITKTFANKLWGPRKRSRDD